MSYKTCKSYIGINLQQDLERCAFLLCYYKIFKQFIYQKNVKIL